MKKAWVLLGFAILLSSSGLLAMEKEVSTKIERVTVFYRGAQISRTTANVELPAGQSVVIIRGLESSLQEHSIRVGIKGKGSILNVVKYMDYLHEEESSQKIKGLQEKMEGISDEIEDMKMQVKVYEQERSMLLSNMKLGGANTGVAVAQIREGAEYYRTRLMEIETVILKTNRSIEQKSLELSKIKNELAELNVMKNKVNSRLEVTIELPAKGSCNLLLDYFIPEAAWVPSYDIRIDEVGGPVQIVRKAAVVQGTGEDWNNVQLIFSTGNPTEKQQVPYLNPWYLNFVYAQQPIMIRGVASKATRSAQAAPMSAELEEVVMLDDNEYDMMNSYANVESSSRNSILEFSLQTRATVKADGKESSFSIGAETIEADYHYQSVPKLQKAAFLIATLTDWEGFELVDGTANIFYEKMYIGQTYLNTSMTLDSLQLSLGKDQGIIVERKTLRDHTRTRAIGSNIKKSFAYDLIIRNTKSVDVELIIEDQIPVSSNSEIEVEVDELSKGSLDEVSGKVTWRITLKAGETESLPFQYSVKYPKKSSVNL